MRKIRFVFILVFLTSFVKAQHTGKVIYGVFIKKENQHKQGVNQDKKQSRLMKSLEEIGKDFELELRFSKGKSQYQLIPPMSMDFEKEALFNMAKIIFKSKGVYYTSLEEKEIVEEKDFMGELFLIKRKQDVSDWSMTRDQKKIGGYLCYKAERDFEYESRKGKSSVKQTVWYCPEIPLFYGPSTFSGFPGLVLEVEIGNITFFAKKIELNKKNKVQIELPSKGKKISEEEFLKLAKTARENLMSR